MNKKSKRKVWFTADPHFGHKNIIEYCDRPFSCVEEMDEYIVNMWNSCVGHNDEVFLLGDVSLFGYEGRVECYLNRLSGSITVIPGSHDYKWVQGFNDAGRVYQESGSGWKIDIELPLCHRRLNGFDVVMCHYPLRTWHQSNRGSVQLHGHTHGRLAPLERQYDVGLDNNNMELVSLEFLQERFRNDSS